MSGRNVLIQVLDLDIGESRIFDYVPDIELDVLYLLERCIIALREDPNAKDVLRTALDDLKML